MRHRPVEGNTDCEGGRPASEQENEPGSGLKPGMLLDIWRVRHRIIALIGDRVFASSQHSNHVFLCQDADGSIQLPTIEAVSAMIDEGTATLVPNPVTPPSPTARMRVEIDMLDAAGVSQGDKAIWIFLAANWTPALEAEFGPHDDPWKIRRWRAALRRAANAPAGIESADRVRRRGTP